MRFLHTSDWQLGMTRHFLSDGAQERFSQARFDAIRTMGQIVRDEKCQFMVVCGDVFESNQVDRKTVARAMEAAKDVPAPIFILPGNHDPLNDASVYRSSNFAERKPSHVHVIENATPLPVGNGVELMGAPWMSKRLVTNPIEDALKAIGPASGAIRICIGHGAVDTLAPDPQAAGVIAVATLERAIAEGKVHFVALGDRHSLTRVGSGQRIWYSGTPEPTDFLENETGRALIVEVNDSQVSIKEVQVGQWRFVERARVDMNCSYDVEALRRSLEDMQNKERAIVRLRLVGSLSLSEHALIQANVIAAKDLFGSLDVRNDELLVMPNETDFSNLEFSGFAQSTVQRLRQELSSGGSESSLVRDALTLLIRLARGTT